MIPFNKILILITAITYISCISCRKNSKAVFFEELFSNNYTVKIDTVYGKEYKKVMYKFTSKEGFESGDGTYGYPFFNVIIFIYEDSKGALGFYKSIFDSCSYDYVCILRNKIFTYEAYSFSRMYMNKHMDKIKSYARMGFKYSDPTIFSERVCLK